MRVVLDEKTHTYSVNGDIASISVTELLHKHKIAPSYKGVNKTKLKESADIGKEVHKDLENVFNVGQYEPKTEQGRQFNIWVTQNIDCGVGEQPLAIDYKGMIVAGTADVMGINNNGERILGDHKNTSKFYKDYVSWQVSILDYMARKLGNEMINGKLLNWTGAKHFYCYKYDTANGNMTVYELEKVSDTEIESLLECEYKGEEYSAKQLVIDNDLQNKFLEAEGILLEKELEYKKAKESAEELREQLKQLFETQGIKSWETPSGLLKVTYIDPIDRIVVDSTKLKKEYPQVFCECQKISKTKGAIRITHRGSEDE